jgi:hypothetical protein
LFRRANDYTLVNANKVLHKVAHQLHEDVVEHRQQPLLDPLETPYLVRRVQLVKGVLQHAVYMAVEIHIIRNFLC